MNDALAGAPLRYASSIPRYPISRLLRTMSEVLLHPVVTLPMLVYLLGGSAGQIAWYAIIAGIAFGLAAASGAIVAVLPQSSRVVIVSLLVMQALGFLVAGLMALGIDALDSGDVLRFSATAYLLLVIPTSMLGRISEQSHEYRQAAAATVGGVVPSVAGSLLAGLVVWRLFGAGGMGPDDIVARLLVSGALFASAAAWLASFPTLLALQLPHPARPMPDVRWPRLRSNRPLMRYATFQTIRGIAQFADPFLFVGVVSIIAPDPIWIGGAVFAFAIGDMIARLFATSAYENINVRVLFTASAFLHVVAFIVVAFWGDLVESSVIADRNPSEQWNNWSVVLAGLALGGSYALARTGHHAYIRSISSPGTRELSLLVAGVVFALTAFSPIIGVRLLDGRQIDTLLQFGVGASIITLLATALIVPTYAAPRRPGRAWGLRR